MVSEIGKSQACTIIDLVNQVSSIVGDKSKISSLETDPVIPAGNFDRRGQANWGDRSKSKKRSSDRRAPYQDKKHKADLLLLQ